MWKKIFTWQSPALVPALAFLVPIVFNLSHNWYVYPWIALAVSMLTALLISLVILGTGSVAYSLCLARQSKAPAWLGIFFKLLVCVIAVEIAFFFAQTQLRFAFGGSFSTGANVLRLVSYGILFVVAYKFSFKPINIFFCSCLGVFLTSGIYGVLTEEGDDSVAVTNINYELHNRPNIYLIFLESYNDLEIQQNVYKIDTSGFEQYLNSNGFKIYKDTFANSWTTLLSYADTFGFKHHTDQDRGNNDTRMFVRDLIGGGKGNALFQILKQNKYRTILLTKGSAYLFHVQGDYLDETDLVYDASVLLNPLLQLNFSLKKFEDKLQLKLAVPYGGERYYSGDNFNRIRTAIEHNKDKAPFFLCIKDGAKHTERPGFYSPAATKRWVTSQYPPLIAKANKAIERITSYIIAHDPGSVIILVGDHGSRRFPDICTGIKDDIVKFNSALDKQNIKLQEFAKDYFGVLLAVRMPFGEPKDISQGLVLSHVNLFRHVFAALNNDLKILQTRVPSVSIINGMTVVREGKVVDVP